MLFFSHIPDRIAYCYTRFYGLIHDFYPVELTVLSVHTEFCCSCAIHAEAAHGALIGYHVGAVFVGPIGKGFVEIRYAHFKLFAGEIAFASHAGVSDTHAYANCAAHKIAVAQLVHEAAAGLFGKVNGGQRAGAGVVVFIAARAGEHALAFGKEGGPERIVGVGEFAVEIVIENLYAGLVAEPVVKGIVGLHDLPGMGMHEEAAVGFDRINELNEAFTCELRIYEVALYAACEFIFREFGKEFGQFVPVRKKHVVMHALYRCLAVGYFSAGLGARDKQAVLPFGQIHMAHLTVVEDGCEVHFLFRHLSYPCGERLLAIAGAAGSGVVVEFAMVYAAVCIERVKVFVHLYSSSILLKVMFAIIMTRWYNAVKNTKRGFLMMKYTEYMPEKSSRVREDIEWSIHYAYDMKRAGLPRVLLIGDSICNGYQNFVRGKLDGMVNVSFWASSKCVTDPDYLRELEFILDYTDYDVVSFNNGLHSLTTDRAEWEAAYAAAVKFIQAKCPNAKIMLTLCTPLRDEKLTAISAELNAFARGLRYPVIDMFTPMDALDRDKYWTDTYHFTDAAKDMQAEIIAARVKDILN